jgi:hypothetical protein
MKTLLQSSQINYGTKEIALIEDAKRASANNAEKLGKAEMIEGENWVNSSVNISLGCCFFIGKSTTVN